MRRGADWLMVQTGRSLPKWLTYVQKRIVKRSRPGKDPNHDETDTAEWMADLEKAVRKSWKKDKVSFDGNMRIAAIVGMILCAWYTRVQLAKTQDPNRPVKLRREAHDRWCAWYQAHCISMVDSRHDPEVFPGQEWESPFLPGARSGSFV